MASLTLTGVKKSFGITAVIHGLDLDVEDGEFVVVVGPSGCGKSTVLRMVAGLEEVTSGEIRIGGRAVNGLEPKDRDVAMVFQNYALYPHMSVRENIAYGLKMRGHRKAAIEARVREVAELLHLGDLLDRRPAQLSGGQRQRVAMGRAMVRSPAAFLFDEPLSNLDAKLRVQMRVEIKRLQRQVGTTSLYVTHDQTEAMTMADRLVVMNGGSVEQVGSPLDIYERPASVFVAGFIGSPTMNLLPARIGDGRVWLADGLALAAPAGRYLDTPDITLGVRPEHLRLGDAAGPDLWLSVDLVEPLGAETLVHGKVVGTDLALTARLHGTVPAALGEGMPLSLDPNHLHFFSRTTGLRLG